MNEPDDSDPGPVKRLRPEGKRLAATVLTIALEELKSLQAIVARHEDHAFKVRSVMYALLTALAVAVLNDKSMLSPRGYVVLSAMVTLLLLFVELVHRAIARMAMTRSSEVEEMVRLEFIKAYDGPRVGLSFLRSRLLDVMINEATMPWIVVHYIGLVILILAIGITRMLG